MSWPTPPETPIAYNPPDGAIIDYALPADASGRVTIEIADASGRVLRSFASDDPPEAVDPEINVPAYWLRPSRNPSAEPGMHRFIWDLKATAPAAFEHDYPIAAIVHDTPRAPEGVLVPPGSYTVRLTAGGRTFARTLHVDMDPRVSASPRAIQEQYDLATRLAAAMNRTFALGTDARAKKDTDAAGRYQALNGNLAAMLALVESADAEPTATMNATSSILIAGVSHGGRIPIKFRGEDEP